MNIVYRVVVLLFWVCILQVARAAQGEMGTGIPEFGLYSNADFAGGRVTIWNLQSASTPFPTGCASITITGSTVGPDSFKQALAIMMTAQSQGKRVRFYAHAERDGGCGVDYVQMIM